MFLIIFPNTKLTLEIINYLPVYMNVLVMKFGGASVSSPKKILNIADIILKRSEEYPKIVVVVSAMGDTTDHLIKLAKKINEDPPKREIDMLISVGERVSISLLSMALAKKDKSSISFTGSQSGIITTNEHSDAKIIDVRPSRIIEELKKERIVIVAGFQGVSLDKEITTLGRGGSDTSAVALAVGLNADKVEFYKDVEGIYDSDPKKNENAKLLSNATYDDILDIVKDKDSILHPRCIKLAKANNIKLHLLSFLNFENSNLEKKGTIISKGSFEKVKKSVYELYGELIK